MFCVVSVKVDSQRKKCYCFMLVDMLLTVHLAESLEWLQRVTNEVYGLLVIIHLEAFQIMSY
jgi:hypothetical protein